MRDYRDVKGQFDAVASIEMFEAVGEEYWPSYFSKIAEVLKPGGRAALQIITIQDKYFEDYRQRADFIQTYIFPGGMLPSPQTAAGRDRARRPRLRDRSDVRAGLRPDAGMNGPSGSSWCGTRSRGGKFDESFRRLWLYYLAYCPAGFRTRTHRRRPVRADQGLNKSSGPRSGSPSRLDQIWNPSKLAHGTAAGDLHELEGRAQRSRCLCRVASHRILIWPIRIKKPIARIRQHRSRPHLALLHGEGHGQVLPLRQFLRRGIPFPRRRIRRTWQDRGREARRYD